MAPDQVRQKIRAPWQRVDFPHPKADLGGGPVSYRQWTPALEILHPAAQLQSPFGEVLVG